MIRTAHRLATLAFDVFQFCIGGTIAKRRLVMDRWSGQRRVLEVGCSTGNIASAFRGRDADYVGLDIDPAAIEWARRKFRKAARFSFVCSELHAYPFGQPFDFVIFSGILHHVDTPTARRLMEFSASLLLPGGVVVVSDPLRPEPGDSLLTRAYRKMERGEFVRSREELAQLLEGLSNLRVVRHVCEPVTALPVFRWPVVSTFGVFVLQHRHG